MAADSHALRGLLGRLALQNLGRRKARSLLLMAAVAIGTGVIFTGSALMRSIDVSMALGLTRLGADLIVVPDGALTNITAALLTVEPTDLVLDADALAKAKLDSVAQYAPQKILRVQHSGIGDHHEAVDFVGFDPARDLTIQPWLAEKINRPLQADDVILGASRDAPLGSQVLIFGKPHIVYGRLSRTGVGIHERGVFLSLAAFDVMAKSMSGDGASSAVAAPGKVTGFLVQLAPGATTLQARFSILSSLKGVKVVSGDSSLSGIRQGLSALLNGLLALMVLLFASLALMVSVLFSAIVTERRVELGLLKAIGTQRSQMIGMMVIEAVIATGLGGVLGVIIGALIMRFYEHSLIYYLERIGIPFIWLDAPHLAAFAGASILLACVIGALGVLYPAWRASRCDPYDLVRGEG
ncbi:MAG: ABC transporter permease [Pseudolabrys sp.]